MPLYYYLLYEYILQVPLPFLHIMLDILNLWFLLCENTQK